MSVSDFRIGGAALDALTSWYMTQNLERRLCPMMPLHEPSNQCVQEYDKHGPQSVRKEECPSSRWDPLGEDDESVLDDIEQK